jgi:serine/threonine protein kinase
MQLIGEGSQAKVFKAFFVDLKMKVAVKMFDKRLLTDNIRRKMI